MKYFYFGTASIFNVPLYENRVDVADTPVNEMIYVSHISTNNMFLLKSYNFNVILCHASSTEHLECIKKIRRANGMPTTHILVTSMEDRADVLFNVNADTDLGITVHFLEDESKIEYAINRIVTLQD